MDPSSLSHGKSQKVKMLVFDILREEEEYVLVVGGGVKYNLLFSEIR